MRKLINPEEQIKKLLQALTAQVAWIDTRLEIYKYLQDCIKDQRIDALNVAPAFFRNVQEALLTDIILGLDKLYADGKDAKRSLVHYLRQVKMHFRMLKPTTESFSAELIQHQLTEIELVRPLLYNLKLHRDRFYAHHDPKYFDNRYKLNEDAPLSPSDLSSLTQLAKDILHTHHGGLLNVERIMRVVNANDVSFVIKSIQRYERMVKEPEIFEILVKRDDLLND
jgi:hypothetical protein